MSEHDDELLTRMRGILCSPWARAQAPRGLRQAWADPAPSGKGASILASYGLKVFLAFYVANIDKPHRKRDEATKASLARSLDQLEEYRLHQIGQALRDTEPHDTVLNALKAISNPIRRRNGFLSKVLNGSASSPSSGSQTHDLPISLTTTDSSATEAPHGASSTTEVPTHDTSSTTKEPTGNHFVNASLKHLAELCPASFYNSIRNNGYEASVVMSFPPPGSGPVHCMMTVGILPEQIENITWHLFGHTVEVRNGRYALNGSLLGRSFNLQQAAVIGILHFLGPRFARAIEKSYVRQEEMARELMVRTNSVTFTIPEDLKEDGILSLTIGFHEGEAFMPVLYPNGGTTEPL